FLFGVPLGIDVGGDFEGGVTPAQLLAGQGDFVVTQGRTVALFLALLVGGTEADDGLAADQGRAIAVGAGHFDGGTDFVRVVAVAVGHHVPAIAFETLGGVVGEPA